MLSNKADPDMPEEYWRQLNEDLDKQASSNFDANNSEIFRKKLIWSARKRGWSEVGDLLNAFVDSGGIDRIKDEDLPSLGRLLVCDDMFLIALVGGMKVCPPELDTPVLRELKQFAQESFIHTPKE